MRGLRRAGLALLVLLPAVLAGGFLWLRSSLPQTVGMIALDGIDAPVEIARDADGIVTIRAANDADAYFALGFAHAQDRLFQMELMRRVGAGRLAEIVGKDAVDLDRRMRTLGLYRLAEANLPLTSLQKLLGHRSPRTTQIYASLSDPALQTEYHRAIQQIQESLS